MHHRQCGRILLSLTFCSLFAIDGYGWSLAPFFHPSIRQAETTMSFPAWVVLGLSAGLIGSRLAKGNGGLLPGILLGVVGAMAVGWSYYAFGPARVNGLNLISLFAAVIGSLFVLRMYYGFRRLKPTYRR
jgi:uncharacterized membrane protein YeaQ/YmgE (transglycosylase-associated protein family)